MIPIMSWRNIWRNRTRSLVVITAIALGIWAAMFMSGFATGMANSYINGAIANVVSHLQIHHPEYSKDFDVKFRIPEPEKVAAEVAQNSQVKAYSVRTIVNGMISSSQGARGIRVRGVEPDAEAGVSSIEEKIKEGEYLSLDQRNPILISSKLAEKLQVKLRSKIVLTFQDFDGEIIAAAFRVIGIFDTNNDPFDQSTVLVLRDDLNRLLAFGNDTSNVDSVSKIPPQSIAHEIAIIVKDPRQVDTLAQNLQTSLPNLKTETYRELAPDLQLYEEQIKTISAIYLAVIMLALVFGIVNTMLMAVLERVRELGMLMAVGMNKIRVFSMIVLETILLCAVAAPFGILLGFLTTAYLGKYGINLSTFSNAMRQFGIADIIYFDLNPIVYQQVPVAIAITAIVASIYPAWKAIRLKPVEAIRKI